MIKGFGSGTATLLLSLFIGERIGSARDAIFVMILGFLAVGLSVYFYVLVQSSIGAVRTSSLLCGFSLYRRLALPDPLLNFMRILRPF